MSFVHLHVHSQFSLLDGTADPKTLVKAAVKRGMPALALTDSANMYGSVAFYKACKDAKIHGITGAELFIRPEGERREAAGRLPPAWQVVALVEDARGYENLCRLVTHAIFHGMEYRPVLTLDDLRRHQDGLIFLSGGRKGPLGAPLMAGDVERTDAVFSRLTDFLAPDRLYLELQDHGLPGQEAINQGLRALAGRSEYRTVVTNAVHYVEPQHAAVHEVLNAIATGSAIRDLRRVQCPTDQAWLKTEEEIRAVFPDDAEAIERTHEIAERCHFKFTLGTYHFPATTPPDTAPTGDPDPDTVANWEYFYRAFPPSVSWGLPDPSQAIPEKPPGAGNLGGYFRWYITVGLEARLKAIPPDRHAEYRERLEFEIKTMLQMGFMAYFLIVAEFINWSKDAGIPVGPGRGSAAGSLAAWAMRITDIDPIRFDLLFERFLNPERVSMPDIDVDFAQDRREESIQHVREKYGYDLVSQIITYGTLKAKAAVRDVARVLEFSFGDADRIAKLIPETLGITLKQALAESEGLRALRDGDPKVRRVLELAMAVEGMCRQTGVHAAGVVIADRPLVEYAPLYRDGPEGGPVVQYDMKSAESVGLIKFDFLGLKTLDQLRDTIAMVEKNHGIKIELDNIDLEDPATFQLLQDGDALGVFQLESSGMRQLLTQLRPSVLDDLVALVALYRPGPLQSGMVSDFVDRKHGRQEVEYPHPVLEPILRSTYGTIVYQEQVMQAAQVMAGYSLGEADLLRRAMGKKDPAEMAKHRGRFVDGSVERGVDAQKASDIFDLLEKFAAYGFNKSHSAAYGVVSYQTAFLKARYRAEYMAALMTIEAGNTDKLLMYIQDSRRVGIEILPVCVNHSESAFSVPKDRCVAPNSAIRFGLTAIKNVGSSSVDAILEAREKRPFRDAMDFFERVDPKRMNKRVYENLIQGGALDFCGVSRARLLAGLDQALGAAARAFQEAASGQGSLFGMFGAAKPPAFRWPDVEDFPTSEKLDRERQVLGMFLSGHPMQAYRADIERFGSCPLGLLDERTRDAESAEVRVVVMAGDSRVIKTKRGDKMAFVVLEDETSAVEAVFFQDAWSRSQKVVQSKEPMVVTAEVERGEEGAIKLRARSAVALSELRLRHIKEMRLRVTLEELTPQRMERLAAILGAEKGPCRTRVVVEAAGRFEAEFAVAGLSVTPTADLEERVNGLFGRTNVVALA